MSASAPIDPALARQLVLDELFDLSLYEKLREIARGDLRRVLDQLIPIEREHVAFWQDFLGVAASTLDIRRRLKLALRLGVCRVLGSPAIHLVLEAIEVYGVRKYLSVWRACEGTSYESAVRRILEDEFEHEDAVVMGDEPTLRIEPERVRNIFLGLNDGLVEILGAVSGFFGAFEHTLTVLVAASTTAVAGALSMAAGAWVATSSEAEVRETEGSRRRFLGQPEAEAASDSPLRAAFVVGMAYFAGALVPMVPVAAGADNALPSAFVAGAVIVLVSTLLAFLSGMNIRRRVLTNLVIIAGAAAISYGIGNLARSLGGIGS